MKTVNVDLMKDIVQSGYCTGCGICESIAPKDAIKINMTTSGYLRPEVKKPLTTETLKEIKGICPGVNIEQPDSLTRQDSIWGPLQHVMTGHATDEKVRFHGSSGGVISAIAIYLIESEKVAFVAQNAVSKENPLLNDLQISRNAKDVIHAAGSRYAPSAPLRKIKDLFALGERFAFVGKPCDVAALRNYLAANPNLKAQVPYMLSFMCAGIPSHKGTSEILNHFSVKPENVKSLRYRGDGWPGKAKIETVDGESYEMDYETSWGTILNRHLQFRCKICPDGTGELADIVCADAWYGEGGYPNFEEKAGRSLILARTQVGHDLIQETRRNNKIKSSTLDVEEIAKMQPYQFHRKTVVLARWIAAGLANRFKPNYKGMRLMRASFNASPVDWLRNGWGTFKRVKKEMI